MSKSINVKLAPWLLQVNSVKLVEAALKANKELTVIDYPSGHYGSYTSPKELVEQGYTHVQVRYGKDLTKAWYGELPK